MAKPNPPEAPQAQLETLTPEEWREKLGTRPSILAAARARNGWAGNQKLTQAEYEAGIEKTSTASLGYLLPGADPKKKE